MARFSLYDDPASAPYAPILERCAGALFDGFRASGERAALIEATGREDIPIAFGSASQVAGGLMREAEGKPDEVRAALRDLAAELLRPRSVDPGVYECVIVTRSGCALISLPERVMRDQAMLSVSLTVAKFRGLTMEPRDPVLVAGLGFAVRNDACAVCRVWIEALRAERIPLTGHTAPYAPPCEGQLCAACALERGSMRKNAGAHYGLDEAAVDEASHPAAVIDAVRLEEDWEAIRKKGAG